MIIASPGNKVILTVNLTSKKEYYRRFVFYVCNAPNKPYFHQINKSITFFFIYLYIYRKKKERKNDDIIICIYIKIYNRRDVHG